MKSSYQMFYYVWTIGMLILGIFGLWFIMLYRENTQEMKENFINYPEKNIPNILPPDRDTPNKMPRHRNIDDI
jgi:hypothetical protein